MDTTNNPTVTNRQRLVVRISSNSLAFSTVNTENGERGVVDFEPYTVKSGISMAANLREALRTVRLADSNYDRVLVMVDTPVLMIPADLFNESEQQTLYAHSFPERAQDVVMHTVLPDLSCVAVFSLHKDIKLVLDDRFSDIRYSAAVAPVWRHLHQRSYTGVRGKLYAYYHDQQLELFSYAQNRFKFCNTFPTREAPDMLYFILNVWKQLQLQADYDEMHLAGDIPQQEWLMTELNRYIKRAYHINPAGEFNRSPVTQIKGMTYDLMILYMKGR